MFKQFGAPIVVGLEIFCQGRPDDSKVKNDSDKWQCQPLYKFWHNKPYQPKIGKFVNSGLISGRVSDLIKYFDWTLKMGYKDDQLALGNFMNDFPELVDADINNSIFHNSTYGVNGAASSSQQLKDSPNLCELTGNSSFFLHIPGLAGSPGQSRIYKICENLLIKDGVSFNWFIEGYEDWYDLESVNCLKRHFD